jgi:hypothetical protein
MCPIDQFWQPIDAIQTLRPVIQEIKKISQISAIRVICDSDSICAICANP